MSERDLIIAIMARARQDLFNPHFVEKGQKTEHTLSRYGSSFHYFFVSSDFESHSAAIDLDPDVVRERLWDELLEPKHEIDQKGFPQAVEMTQEMCFRRAEKSLQLGIEYVSSRSLGSGRRGVVLVYDNPESAAKYNWMLHCIRKWWSVVGQDGSADQTQPADCGTRP